VLSEHLFASAVSAAIAIILCGCVDVPATTPSVAEIAPQTLGLSTEVAPQSAESWWMSFNDTQADHLISLMFEASPTLQGAMTRIHSAQSELAVAQSQVYPQVNLDGQVQSTLLSNDYLFPTSYGGSWRWVSDIENKVTWSLDFWGKQQALIDKAQNLVQARTLDLHAARLALAGSFAQFYIGLLVAYQNIDIARQTVSERQSVLALTQSRIDSGLENEASLEQAKALLAAAQVDVMIFEADRDLAVHAIAALTGQGAAAYDQIVRPTASLDTALPLPSALPIDLLSRRPDILAARARITAAAQGREAAHADFYPNIDLTATLGIQAVGLSNLLNGFTMGVGPAVHLPIFDEGKIRAQYAMATADLDLAVSEYNGAVLLAVRQTGDSLTEIKSLANRRAREQDVLDSATRAFRLAEERYRLGVSDQITVLTAESLLLQAREQMVALSAQLATQRVNLLLSVGEGNPTEANQKNQGRLHDE
jgi:NodT family efflux transporter outer membrane factor (OMF) lipoprotein